MNIQTEHFYYWQGSRSVLILLCLTLFSHNTLANIQYHSLDDIRQTAKEFVLANLSNHDQESSVISSKLDPRLRLKSCSQPLEAFYPEYGRRVGNITVGIRCTSEDNWSIFVPISVKIYREVVIATRPLNRGTIINESDVRLEKRNISVFSSDFYTDSDLIIGQELVHSIQMGRSLGSHDLKSPTAIKRGSLVTLLAKNNVFEVRMEGKALADGVVGERIRVQNLRSKRIVEGIVKSSKIIYVQ